MMKNTALKNALIGIGIALLAAYMFPVVLISVLEWPHGLIIFFTLAPLYGLLYSFWLAIPLGAALGMLIPQIAKGKTRWMAALHGAGFGALAGIVSIFCFTSVFHMEEKMSFLWLSVVAYCALWVGGYAFYRAKGQSLYR